jgi:ABC-type antimicrobial peptide transport system ATPase subunit
MRPAIRMNFPVANAQRICNARALVLNPKVVTLMKNHYHFNVSI